MVNSLKLKAKIVELGITQGDVAVKMNIARSSLGLKINNKRPMTVTEAQEISEILEISDNEYGSYFFT